MSVEAVEKRDRRVKRRQLKVARFRRSVEHYRKYPPIHPDVCSLASLTATWDAVRRVAAEIIQWHCPDVGTAWGIVRFVDKLPDGKKRLQAAVDAALAKWEQEAQG